jgi:hypothetical protein
MPKALKDTTVAMPHAGVSDPPSEEKHFLDCVLAISGSRSIYSKGTASIPNQVKSAVPGHCPPTVPPVRHCDIPYDELRNRCQNAPPPVCRT